TSKGRMALSLPSAATAAVPTGRARTTIMPMSGFIAMSSTRIDVAGRLPQRLERRPKIGHEDLRLLPGRKVAAFVGLVVVDELRIGLLRPAPRSLIELLRKGAHGRRDGDVLRGEERELALPVQAGRRDRRVRQPVERDVVEDVVARQALG